jgi:hypothetical protein
MQFSRESIYHPSEIDYVQKCITNHVLLLVSLALPKEMAGSHFSLVISGAPQFTCSMIRVDDYLATKVVLESAWFLRLVFRRIPTQFPHHYY